MGVHMLKSYSRNRKKKKNTYSLVDAHCHCDLSSLSITASSSIIIPHRECTCRRRETQRKTLTPLTEESLNHGEADDDNKRIAIFTVPALLCTIGDMQNQCRHHPPIHKSSLPPGITLSYYIAEFVFLIYAQCSDSLLLLFIAFCTTSSS